MKTREKKIRSKNKQQCVINVKPGKTGKKINWKEDNTDRHLKSDAFGWLCRQKTNDSELCDKFQSKRAYV